MLGTTNILLSDRDYCLFQIIVTLLKAYILYYDWLVLKRVREPIKFLNRKRKIKPPKFQKKKSLKSLLEKEDPR